MPAARGKLAVAQTTSAQLTVEMLELRKQGWTYQAIGDQYGITAPSAYQRVKKALHDLVAEPAEEVRQIELQRLDRMQQAVDDKIAAGELRSIDQGLRIMDMRAKLLGLYAPVKVEADVVVAEAEQMNATVYAIIQAAGTHDGDRPAIHG